MFVKDNGYGDYTALNGETTAVNARHIITLTQRLRQKGIITDSEIVAIDIDCGDLLVVPVRITT